jgi:uncharacterized phage protein gp47/JayE
MATTNDVVAQMRATLAITEPDLDTSIGTTTRKILDAVGETVAEAYADQYLMNYQYDLDAKAGADLDDFVALFGFTRHVAKRSTGVVTFERQNAAPEGLFLSSGLQVSTQDFPPLVFTTTVPAVLEKGSVSISVPVQAVQGGSQGNISPGAISRIVTPVEGFSSVGNTLSFSGGTDAESDESLRIRFRRTVFRNLAGTDAMFLGLALEDSDVTQANVLGANKYFREQIQVVNGSATSTLQQAFSIYPGSSVLGVNIDGGEILLAGIHYTFDATVNPPTITKIVRTIPPGETDPFADGIYELEYEYVPRASRNNPASGITNRVDIYVNGMRTEEARETAIFLLDQTFNNTAGSPLNRNNFRRATDNTIPQNGNIFVRYAFSPVVDPALSDFLVINGVTYQEGVDFFLVNDITSSGGTSTSLSGIEWKTAANGAPKVVPPNNTAFSLNYAFNVVPRDVEDSITQWGLVSTDVRVHQARRVLLNAHLAVMLAPGFSRDSVKPAIFQAISDLMSGIAFNGVVQVSDVLGVVMGVAGVDAVRFLHSSDVGDGRYAMQEVSEGGDIITTYATNVTGQIRRAIDVLMADDQVPVLNDLIVQFKAQNTMGA